MFPAKYKSMARRCRADHHFHSMHVFQLNTYMRLFHIKNVTIAKIEYCVRFLIWRASRSRHDETVRFIILKLILDSIVMERKILPENERHYTKNVNVMWQSAAVSKVQ
jgi:hypothetical protein